MVATAKAPVPDAPGMSTMPLPPRVAATATTSGTGVLDPDRKTVVTRLVVGAGTVLEQSKRTGISLTRNGLVGWKLRTNVAAPPPGTTTGVFGTPTTAFVNGSVRV